MATLKDVAEKVGVSITTVSRVMNGRGAISRETRDKVFAAMKELNYFPNEMARSLGNKSSHLIGLIVPYIDHAFFGILTAAIEEACYKSGYKLFFCTSGGNPNRERELFKMLCANNVAGVLVCSRITDESLYMQTDVPIVTIERMIEDVPSVSCDNYKGGVLAAQEQRLERRKHRFYSATGLYRISFRHLCDTRGFKMLVQGTVHLVRSIISMQRTCLEKTLVRMFTKP